MNLFELLSSSAADSNQLPCSRAGCDELAIWRINWRNPKIHQGDRSKNWLACDNHLEYLEQFLQAREFPLQVSKLEPKP